LHPPFYVITHNLNKQLNIFSSIFVEGMSTPFNLTVYDKLGKKDLQRCVFNKLCKNNSSSTVL